MKETINLLKTPTGRWYVGASLNKIAKVYNASLSDTALHVQRENLFALRRGERRYGRHKLCSLQTYDSISDVEEAPEGVTVHYV